MSKMILYQASTWPMGGSAVSPCLRAFCDETALPWGVLGPVARLGLLTGSSGSLCRRGQHVNWPRRLQLAVLRRQQAHALFEVGQGLPVAAVFPAIEYLPTQHEPRVNPKGNCLRGGRLARCVIC